MRKKHNSTTSRHHIIPKSRGGKKNIENIVKLGELDHRDYHNLFDNMTPPEIIENLVNKYWKGNWDYVETAYKKYNG